MRKKHFTRQVGLIISEESYKQLIEQTNREEVTISEWIREAILSRLCMLNSAGPVSIHNDQDGKRKRT